jgi:hypothetical protein
VPLYLIFRARIYFHPHCSGVQHPDQVHLHVATAKCQMHITEQNALKMILFNNYANVLASMDDNQGTARFFYYFKSQFDSNSKILIILLDILILSNLEYFEKYPL